jgi:beta-lactamase superfamily II metal-dependent hydrolase
MLRIIIHDVGHGQAIHAFTPGGQTVAIDLGCSDWFSPLEWLRRQTACIDYLVVTHPHGDHIDEIFELDDHGFQIRQIWRPKWLAEEAVRTANQGSYREKVDEYFAISTKFSNPIPDGQYVGLPENSGGVSIQTFASSDCGQSNINNHSGVVVFEYLGVKVVIPGDNEPASWRSLLKQQSFRSSAQSADIILASHHGRESGYCADLFDERSGIGKPRLCVVSDGRVQDTDARGRYTHHANGWKIHSRGGLESADRYCVTTRYDGFIEIEIGTDASTSNTYLSVKRD